MSEQKPAMSWPTLGGLVQLITGLLALLYQGYGLFHGVPPDVAHSAVGVGMMASGAAHLSNGRH